MFLFILLLSLYNVEYFKVVNLSLDESGQSVFFSMMMIKKEMTYLK